MKFLREFYSGPALQILEESTKHGKKYFIQGPFMVANKLNKNGRIYPIETMRKEVARYNADKIQRRSSIGELNHPRDSTSIDLSNISHVITELYETKNGVFIGKAEILDNDSGRKVIDLIENGIPLGVSLRGFGDIRKTMNGDIVGENFYLQTVDIVAEPSFEEAQMTILNESKDYFIDDKGHVKEQINEEMLLEAFTKFISKIQ